MPDVTISAGPCTPRVVERAIDILDVLADNPGPVRLCSHRPCTTTCIPSLHKGQLRPTGPLWAG